MNDDQKATAAQGPLTQQVLVTATLNQVTQEILARMRIYRFRYRGRFAVPLPWDINNGWCEEWAERAEELIPGAYAECMLPGSDDDSYHTWLVYRGRSYDAECTGGVDDPRALPFFAEPENPRPEP